MVLPTLQVHSEVDEDAFDLESGSPMGPGRAQQQAQQQQQQASPPSARSSGPLPSLPSVVPVTNVPSHTQLLPPITSPTQTLVTSPTNSTCNNSGNGSRAAPGNQGGPLGMPPLPPGPLPPPPPPSSLAPPAGATGVGGGGAGMDYSVGHSQGGTCRGLGLTGATATSCDSHTTEERFLMLQSRLAKTRSDWGTVEKERCNPYLSRTGDESDSERFQAPTPEALAHIQQMLPPSRLADPTPTPAPTSRPQTASSAGGDASLHVVGHMQHGPMSEGGAVLTPAATSHSGGSSFRRHSGPQAALALHPPTLHPPPPMLPQSQSRPGSQPRPGSVHLVRQRLGASLAAVATSTGEPGMTLLSPGSSSFRVLGSGGGDKTSGGSAGQLRVGAPLGGSVGGPRTNALGVALQRLVDQERERGSRGALGTSVPALQDADGDGDGAIPEELTASAPAWLAGGAAEGAVGVCGGGVDPRSAPAEVYEEGGMMMMMPVTEPSGLSVVDATIDGGDMG